MIVGASHASRPGSTTVIAGSAAETAGFKAGDLIVAIDGRTIEAFQDVAADRQRQRRARS